MKTKHTFKIFEGYDHFNNKPIYNVRGINNQYFGEWCETLQEAQTELKELI